MFVKTHNGSAIDYPYGLAELRRDNPQTSFPNFLSEGVMADYGIHPVQPTAKPAFNRVTEKVEEGTPELVDGQWVQTWQVVAASADEIAARRAGLELTFAQMLIGLVAFGWITEAEGEAWLTGTLPAPVLGIISTLPAEQQFPAKARASRPSVVMRSDPLVSALAAAQGKTEAELDAFFLTYAGV
jgi:hypothetical protein